jgi:tetratricopeptide (TPR) repeat protein
MGGSALRETLLREMEEDFSYSLGNAALARGRHDEALELYGRALKVKPDNAKVFHNMAVALEALGRGEEAARTRAAIAADRHSIADACFDLAITFHIQSQVEPSLEFFRRAVATDPTHVETLWSMATLLNSLQRFDEAADACEKALAVSGDYFAVRQYLTIGHILQLQERYEGALTAFRRAIVLEPENYGNYLYAASAELDLNKTGDALARAKRATVTTPLNAWPTIFVARACEMQGDLAQAEAAYRLAVDKEPGRPWPHVNLAGFLQDLGRHDEALAALRPAQSLAESDPWVNIYVGYSLLALGRRGDALQAFRIGAWAPLDKGSVLFYCGRGALSKQRLARQTLEAAAG